MHYSKQHNVCIYPLKDHAQAVSLTTGFFKIGEDQVAVPCTLHNMQIMAALGYEAISPIMFEYDWPSIPGRTPWEHQKHMSAFHTLHPRCFDLSDMGIGKSMATIWAWDYLMLKGEVKQVIIDCTMSCMEDVWWREIMTNLLGRRKAVIVHGTREKRVECLRQPADFYIINHDGVALGAKQPEGKRFEPGPLAEYLRANPSINGVTIDEGAESFRHQTTDVYKSTKHALRDKPYFNWLTGTPTPKDPTDAYAQAKMVRLDYNENFMTFRERTMYKAGPFKWKPKADGYETAASILTPAIRYDREASGIKLPPVVIEDRTADLSPAQVKAIKDLRTTLKTMVDGGQINALNEASLRIKLLQICCGAVYGDGKKVLKVDCASRLNILHEVIAQSKAKIIIFASFTNVVDMLYSELSKSYTVEKIDGSVSSSARADIFRNFRDSQDPRVIVAHPGTMAHGLNLTAASTTIWFGPPDDAGIFSQANKRMDRPGQQNSMLMVRVSSTKIERGIYKRLDESQSLQGLMLDLIQGA